MSSPDKKFYVTTPIYYVNARPHIGHAYTTIVADVVARRHRLLGHRTFFLTGTDEHGQKIERSAAAAGIPPQQFADGVSQSFQDLWARMGITNDDFIRTTDPRHKHGVQKLFAELYARGEIYLSSYTGQYSVGEEMFVDGPPGTLGPDGRPTETVTEENFFFRLSRYQLPLLDLIESHTLTIQPDSRRNEVLSFLRGNLAPTAAPATPPAVIPTEVEGPASSRPQPQLGQLPRTAAPATPPSVIPTEVEGPASSHMQHATTSPGAPSMAQSHRDMGGNVSTPPATHQPATLTPGAVTAVIPTEVEGPAAPTPAYTAAGTPYLPGALKDLSVSRSSFTWGIPVPEPAASAAKEPHVIYVWLDALANYMTALGYGSDDPADQARFQEFWPADLHLVGKEIIRFHCVYWPAFLLALNPASMPPHFAEVASSTPVIAAETEAPAFPPPSTPSSRPETLSEPQASRTGRSGETPVLIVDPATAPSGAPFMAQSHRDMGGSVTPQLALIKSVSAAGEAKQPGSLTPETPSSRPETLSELQASRTGRSGETPVFAFDPAWAAKMLPKSVVAHGWLLFEDSKMSKSRGNIVRTETILSGFGDHYRREFVRLGQSAQARQAQTSSPDETPHTLSSFAEGGGSVSPQGPTKHEADLFASDVLRYFLLREIPFGQDGSFSFDAMITRYNADLANGYGNLVSRVLQMIAKYRSSTIPTPPERPTDAVLSRDESGSPISIDFGSTTVANFSKLAILIHRDAFKFLRFSSASNEELTETSRAGVIDACADFMSRINEYVTSGAPWKLAVSDILGGPAYLDEVLYTAAEAIRILTALLYPILPYSTAKVWAQLGLGSIEDAAREGKLKDLQWGGLTPGTRLGPLAPIFPRAPKELAQIMSDSETKPSLTAVTADNDAATSDHTEFREAPLSDVAAFTVNQPAVGEVASETASSGQGSSGSPPSAPLAKGGVSSEALPSSAPGTNPSGAPYMAQSHRDMGGNVNPPSATLQSGTDPSAPPRTSTLPHDNPGAQVGGSSAPGPELTKPPSHTQTPGSGLFAGTAATPQITIDDFAKVELRVAKILVAERIPKADKLLRLEVDLGPELGQRQILSGIAEWYPPESLVGRTIVVITNLAPRKMRGLESHGMLLAGSAGDGGKPILATFAEGIAPGTRLK